MNQKHQTIEIGIIQEKVRDANLRIDAMSAVSFRQKNEEAAELRQQVEIHKTTISELQRKQDLTNDLKEDLVGIESSMERVINEFVDGVNAQLQNTHRASGNVVQRMAELESESLMSASVDWKPLASSYSALPLPRRKLRERSMRWRWNTVVGRWTDS